MGQPINHPLRSLTMRRWLRAGGFEVVAAHGAGHYLPLAGREPRRFPALDRATALRYLALFIARRESATGQ